MPSSSRPAFNRSPTLWQWFATGVVVLVLHALVWRSLQSPLSTNTPKVISRIEVELTAPPQPLPVAPPKALVPAVPKPRHTVRPAVPRSAKPVERRVETQAAQPEPARIPQSVSTPSVQSMQNDTAPSAPADTPTSDSPTSSTAASSSSTENEPITAPRFNAAYLHNPTPVYPAAARRTGYEGTVVIRARIQIDGSADRIEIKKSSDHSVLDQAALEAVRKWRFVPARRGNEAVVEWVEIPWQFKLEE